MRAGAHIDLAAMGRNLDRVRELSPGARVLAVIKSNGYGHGLIRAANALGTAEGFAVTNVEEALALREAGVSQRILVLEGFFSLEELDALRTHGVDTVVHHEAQIEMLERAGAGPPVTVWLKVDTGMHRLGIPPARLNRAWDRLRGCAHVPPPPVLMSHLAKADERENPHTRAQIHRLLSLASGLGAVPSLANSAAVLAWPAARVGWVRSGILLYGISPFPTETAGAFGLLPVMTLSTRLIAVNRIPRGEAVGYGGTWVCPEDMPVGVAAIGYGDGYPRHAPSGCPVLVNGERVPLIGRVSMDMITLDLRTQPDARIGDPVVLWGKGLPVEKVARFSGTIGYELVCGVTTRVGFMTRDA
uniref:Alanine racemase n=1 Tax=Candidatus Kentrum eta TaxID=2126337 RepID=A0A450V8S1_9GAMM|nr:MAG: alanine racemase [Candidatus Kentron sp. H]VFK01178.1 MAG: alanine racemase [Candidatus Kentron sp. H]VFK05375.1 MAG: alanine racemase [Candidatus Kentron sp. H]